MKVLCIVLGSLLLSLTVSAQLGQLPNGGFENWNDDVLFESPMSWRSSNTDEYSGMSNVTKINEASDGNHALQLEVIMQEGEAFGGYIYFGELEDGPSGGIDYSDSFNEISLTYQADLQSGDSLQLMLVRYSNGSVVSMDLMPLVNGSANSWTNVTVSIDNLAQDEVFLGLILGDPEGNVSPALGSWVKIDNVQLSLNGTSTENVPNHSFENWEEVTVTDPEDWNTINPFLSSFGITNVAQTTDAHTGQFAAEITGLDLGAESALGFLSLGAIDLDADEAFSTVPFDATPTTLSGAYKYSPDGDDTGGIQAIFLQDGNIIGTLAYPFTEQTEYLEFTVPLTITGTPDELMFLISSGDNGGSVLKIDDFQFSGGDVSITEYSSIIFDLYPNPASNIVFIELENSEKFSYIIFDQQGRKVQEENTITNNAIDTSDLTTGVYFTKVFNTNASEIKKLIIN